jgi:hypothetical protein
VNYRAFILVVAAIVILILVVGIVLVRRRKQRRSELLRSRFGPEYDRVVAEHRDQGRAEEALEEREKRSLEIIIRPLSPEDRERFVQAWRTVQAHFVDAPGEAVIEADQLLEQLMNQRGYPIGGFEQQAADLSVDHPRVIENYRLAHAIADRQRRGRASTEDLREAIIQYRALYEELLGVPSLIPSEVKR